MLNGLSFFFQRVPLSEMISRYPVYHERDISRFNEAMDKRYNGYAMKIKFQQFRKDRQRSLSELSSCSGDEFMADSAL